MDSTGYTGNMPPARNHFANSGAGSQNNLEINIEEDYLAEETQLRPKSHYFPSANSNAQSGQKNRLKSAYNGKSGQSPAGNGGIKLNKSRKPGQQEGKAKMKNLTGRTKPKHILHEPERLREQVFALNRQLVDHKESNEDLTRRLAVLEIENDQYEKIIQENECFWNIGTRGSDSTLLTNLKKECNKLEDELRDKEAGLKNCEKNVKNTKLNELRIEVEILEEECQNLQSTFKDMMSECDGGTAKGLTELEEKYYKQKNLLGFLEKDNKEMDITLKIVEEQNKTYQEEIRKYEENIRQNEDEREEQKILMRSKEAQIKHLRREANEAKIGSNELYMINEHEVKLGEVRELEKKLADLKKEEARQERYLKEAEEEFRREKQGEMDDKKRLKEELEHLKNMQEVQDHDESDGPEPEDYDEAVQVPQIEQINAPEEGEQAVVAKISQLVQMRLRVFGKQHSEVSSYLCGPTSMETGQATLETVSRNLEDSPFYLDRSDAKLLCYSMGRECELENFEQTTEMIGISRAFKNLVGDYTCLSQQDEISLETHIYKKYFKERPEDIKKAFESVVSHKDEHLRNLVTIDEVGTVLASCGCKVNKEHLSHLHLMLFKENDSVQDLPWEKLCEIFGPNYDTAKGEAEIEDELMVDL